MQILEFIFIGIVQGFTEFLPISSSGHLVIVQSMIPGFNEQGLLLEVTLHAGTLLSILYYFRKSLKKTQEYWLLIIIATIPAVLFGFVFSDQISQLFDNLKAVGIALLITGIINYMTTEVKESGDVEKFDQVKRNTVIKSLIIGVFQALAIIPGISRSGSTIFAGRKMGLKKRSAAEFSFLMSIPTVLGANVYEYINSAEVSSGFSFLYFVGFVSAFLSGVVAIGIVIKLLEKANYKYFAYYAVIVGLVVILVS